RRMEDGFLVRGEEDVLNELDENAVEAAVSLVEELGGEVVTLTMGPEDAEDALMRALQMGADRGVLISDEALAGADAGLTALALAGAIQTLADEKPIDLVITGMASL
nr:electron transfer flavoprotein subunit beta [Streptococcus anginosus]